MSIQNLLPFPTLLYGIAAVPATKARKMFAIFIVIFTLSWYS